MSDNRWGWTRHENDWRRRRDNEDHGDGNQDGHRDQHGQHGENR